MIISVFGKNGSGKTTISTHIARALADKNHFVGIVSIESRYGSIQRSLGIKINEDSSIINAIIQINDIKKYFVEYTKNIYVLSLSDFDDITKYDALNNISKDDNILSSFLSKLNKSFDYVIIDLTEMIIDNLTFFMAKNSDKLLNIIESRPESIAFADAHKNILKTIINENKIINVLNKHDESIINKNSIQRIYGNIDFVLDFDLSIIKDERENNINKYVLKNMQSILSQIQNNNIIEKNKGNVFSKIKILGRR